MQKQTALVASAELWDLIAVKPLAPGHSLEQDPCVLVIKDSGWIYYTTSNTSLCLAVFVFHCNCIFCSLVPPRFKGILLIALRKPVWKDWPLYNNKNNSKEKTRRPEGNATKRKTSSWTTSWKPVDTIQSKSQTGLKPLTHAPFQWVGRFTVLWGDHQYTIHTTEIMCDQCASLYHVTAIHFIHNQVFKTWCISGSGNREGISRGKKLVSPSIYHQIKHHKKL